MGRTLPLGLKGPKDTAEQFYVKQARRESCWSGRRVSV